jgi:glycosidase
MDWSEADLQMKDPASLYQWNRELVRLRNTYRPLNQMNYTPLKTSGSQILSFMKRAGEEYCAVLINFSRNDLRTDLELPITASLSLYQIEDLRKFNPAIKTRDQTLTDLRIPAGNCCILFIKKK